MFFPEPIKIRDQAEMIKANAEEDLKKARWYIERELQNMAKAESSGQLA